MGPLFALFAVAALCGVLGAILFGVVAAAIWILPVENKKKALLVAGVVAGGCAALVWLGYAGLIFIGLPNDPENDFRMIFERKLPASVAIVNSASSAGSDYTDVRLTIRISQGDLAPLVSGWKPGPVDLKAMPDNDAFEWGACKSWRGYVNERHSRHTMEYSAVLYCPQSRTATAVYTLID